MHLIFGPVKVLVTFFSLINTYISRSTQGAFLCSFLCVICIPGARSANDVGGRFCPVGSITDSTMTSKCRILYLSVLVTCGYTFSSRIVLFHARPANTRTVYIAYNLTCFSTFLTGAAKDAVSIIIALAIGITLIRFIFYWFCIRDTLLTLPISWPCFIFIPFTW